jgi:hypothetical protein
MALKSQITLQAFGQPVVIQNAYVRVHSIQGTKQLLNFSTSVCNENASEELVQQNFSFVPNMDGENFIKQAYRHLKTLPAFANATDC